MSLVDFIILIVISGLAGLVGQQIAGYQLGGLLAAIVIGFIGAILGLWLARELDLPVFFLIEVGEEGFPVVWSVIGSALLSLGIGLFTRRRPQVF